ncbi:DUF5642 family protein [Jiangella asiatica]|uniref:Uncharacterized protein n=1 Tax=Jiangella asiatica TaxID=2530372 RepID=A0A4R5D635_9ACTN|nr:DUF5642 family protein [Jiangella asiatica]TDE08952.1 hypothetical protein E1269_16160 [Jiangella asiatica]
MRKLGISALIAATLFLTACGGDDESTDDETTTSEESAGGEETPEETATDDAAEDDAAADEGGTDLSAAVLAAEDLPADVEIMPFDATMVSDMGASMAGMLEGITYEPADCQGYADDPLQRDGVESAGISAISGTDVFVSAVYTGASADDVAAVEDYYGRCAEIAISGEAAGQPVDMTLTTEIVDAPAVDADEAIAIETTTVMPGVPETPMRIIYMIDGDRGVYVAGNPESAVFELDALAPAALDKLRAAQG